MSGQDYLDWDAATDANEWAYTWAATQLKLVIIPDETIGYIIEKYCAKEEGVRTLKRCIEIIYTKLNLYRLMKPDTNLFEEDMSIKVSFPFQVTKDIVDKLIKQTNSSSDSIHGLYI